MSVVLVTGATRFLGSELAGRLAADPEVDRVITVDAANPDPATTARLGNAKFVRADIRNPLIAKVIETSGVDTVVHASASSSAASASAKVLAKEMNVLGTMQLLAACQVAPAVKHLVVRSTAAVYGGSPRDPAVFTEETEPHALPSSGPARDAADIEGYLRGFSRRRPDVRVAVARFAEVIGPSVRTPLTRYFSLTPTVPVLFGRDARVQFVHEQDAVEVLYRLTVGDWSGVVNVAGAGTMTVSQAIRRAGRVPVPLPGPVIGTVGRALRAVSIGGLRLGGFSPEQVQLLANGRSLDTSRLRDELGIALRYSTEEAFADFAATLPPAPGTAQVSAAEHWLQRTIGAGTPARGESS